MIGISLSPLVASLFRSFTTSFVMALGLFGISLFYVLVFVRWLEYSKTSKEYIDGYDQDHLDDRNQVSDPPTKPWQKIKDSIISPLKPFQTVPVAILPGLSLLIYNGVQSYIFSAIMVYCSLRFGFSGKQNGMLIFLAHAVSALYLFFVLFLVPLIVRSMFKGKLNNSPSFRTWFSKDTNALLALLSIVVQITSLSLLGLATEAWEIYPITALSALGLATPSFVKSHFIEFFAKPEASQAIAALAMMETLGGLLGPVLLGGWQTIWPGNGVFFAAAIVLGISASLFGAGAVVMRRQRRARSSG